MDTTAIASGIDARTLRAIDAAKGAATPADAADRFEALLGQMLVKELRRSAPEGFFGDSSSGDIYSGWLDEHLGRVLADSGTLRMRETLQRGVEEKMGVVP